MISLCYSSSVFSLEKSRDLVFETCVIGCLSKHSIRYFKKKCKKYVSVCRCCRNNACSVEHMRVFVCDEIFSQFNDTLLKWRMKRVLVVMNATRQTLIVSNRLKFCATCNKIFFFDNHTLTIQSYILVKLPTYHF